MGRNTTGTAPARHNAPLTTIAATGAHLLAKRVNGKLIPVGFSTKHRASRQAAELCAQGVRACRYLGLSAYHVQLFPEPSDDAGAEATICLICRMARDMHDDGECPALAGECPTLAGECPPAHYHKES